MRGMRLNVVGCRGLGLPDALQIGLAVGGSGSMILRYCGNESDQEKQRTKFQRQGILSSTD